MARVLGISLSVSFVLLSSIAHIALCSPTAPEITPPPLLQRADVTADPGFEGFSSLGGTWSPVLCPSGSAYKNVASAGDCCPISGKCNPATACSGSNVVLKDGQISTCSAGCATGLIYQTIDGESPHSKFGCFAPFKLYRNTNTPKAAVPASTSNSTGTASSTSNPAPASNPTSLSSSPSPTSSPASSPVISPGIIAGAIVLAIVLVSAITGLVTYICLSKKRQSPAKGAPITELPATQSGRNSYRSGYHMEDTTHTPKCEEWVELPATPAGSERMPESPQLGAAPSYEASNASTLWNGNAVELPTRFSRGYGHSHYKELKD